MSDLGGGHVFLAASFPSGERAQEVGPFDADAIADAVTAVVRAVLLSDGKLLFGGHPTITPLVLSIGIELEVEHAVDIFQSRWFERDITAETVRLVDSGVGDMHWTIRRDTRDESLEEMRREMFAYRRPLAAIFVGGMDGIYDEFRLVEDAHPEVPRIPLAGPGGAAARLASGPITLPSALQSEIGSRHYPFLAAQIVDVIAGQDRPEDSGS